MNLDIGSKTCRIGRPGTEKTVTAGLKIIADEVKHAYDAV